MTHRYFVESPITTDRVSLGGSEAHHLLHVMRATAGTEVVLFDGAGTEFRSRVEKVGRSTVQLAILSRAAVSRELPIPVALGVALPTQTRRRWLVEKAVELGVARVVPLVTERAVRPGAQALGRLRRAVVEASKQCGRNRLMEIEPPCPWLDYIRRLPPDSRTPDCHGLVAHPGRTGFRPQPLGSSGPALPPPREVLLAVGPEGGLTSEEVSAAQARGWDLIDLGPRVLRVETAALVLSAMAALWTGSPSEPQNG
jgi:16S rRNA (uracil1498-N3)-methyltransferase